MLNSFILSQSEMRRELQVDCIVPLQSTRQDSNQSDRAPQSTRQDCQSIRQSSQSITHAFQLTPSTTSIAHPPPQPNSLDLTHSDEIRQSPQTNATMYPCGIFLFKSQ